MTATQRNPFVAVIALAILGSPAVRTLAAEKVKNVTFNDIKFEMKKDEPFQRSMLTPNIEALHGQKVKVRGWMLPAFQAKGLKHFVLVRCNNECCFGPGAALHDSIQVYMNEGTTTEYVYGPIVVEGVFTIKEYEDQGQIWSVYRIQASKAK